MSDDEFTAMELEMNMEDALTSISIDINEEIAELSTMVALAEQAEYQYLDAKFDPLIQIIDDLYAEESERKVIVFTEFIATQSYLSGLLSDRGYKVSILNGSMSIEERNDVLDVFRTATDILISTDTGGEGLNLQFANTVINYDLPWNPMKIEQRIGRVDRIGQQRDVIAYNFILTDTVESRVREVLEEKLLAILAELGADKYSDVLDGEAAEINFTEAYMRSIRDPKSAKYAASVVEDDFRQQVDNTLKIKDLISESKDLSELVGADTGFDLDASLRAMLVFYECSIGNPVPPIEQYSISDPQITRHLGSEVEFSANSKVPVLLIKGFPNEKGYFMLWELSVSSDEQSRRFIPIFVNDEMVLRPLAGRKIWEAILDENNTLTVTGGENLSHEHYENLVEASRDFAYDTFINLKEETEKRRDETFRKYMYALNLRFDAADRIGIENIRKHKLSRLAIEKASAEKSYHVAKAIFPEFKPVLFIRMEDGNA